jgi:hypothetical protein
MTTLRAVHVVRRRRHDEELPVAGHRRHGLPQLDRQLVGVDDAAVVAERFGPGGLLVGRHERQVADLEQFRRREEHHLQGKMEDGVDDDALLQDDVAEPVALGGDRGGETGRAGTDDDEVVD